MARHLPEGWTITIEDTTGVSHTRTYVGVSATFARLDFAEMVDVRIDSILAEAADIDACATCGQVVVVVSRTSPWHGLVQPTPKAPAGTPGRACEHEGATNTTVARLERMK